MEGPVQAAGMGPVIRGVEETSALAVDSLITQEHSLQLVENLRKIYDEDDCFLHDVNKRFHAHVKTMKHEKLEVTRSNKPSRSTRTFTKKTSSSALTKSVASPSEEDMESVPPPKTPSREFFTPKRKSSSSIANSLRKVSAARKISVVKVVEEQEVMLTSPPRKGSVIRKSPKLRTDLNNSRAPSGKIIKSGANKKVAASGGLHRVKEKWIVNHNFRGVKGSHYSEDRKSRTIRRKLSEM